MSARFHALDGLRAALMFLGIWFHAAVAYSDGERPFKSPELTPVFDYSITLIHAFRMPMFFVLAGFFAALLLQRYGFRRATANRALRIALPFVVGWVLLYPLTIFFAIWVSKDIGSAHAFFAGGTFLGFLHPLHLWFLEYLLVLYALAALFAWLAHRFVPDEIGQLLNLLFRRTLRARWALLPFAVASFLVLLAMNRAGLDDPPSFLPAPRIVMAYAVPFAFGWWLFANDDLLTGLRERAWHHAAFAALAGVVYVTLAHSFPDIGSFFWLGRAAHALFMWGAIFGLTGLFLRFLSRRNALQRYLCDSSYFLYIAHLPLIVALQLALQPVALPAFVKAPLVCLLTTAILLAVYRWLVRPSFVGAVLNGRRHDGGATDVFAPGPTASLSRERGKLA